MLFVSHAFPRHRSDLPGNFLLLLATSLAEHGVDVAVVAPASAGSPARDRVAGIAVRRYRYAPRRLETIAYTGAMAVRAATPGGALAVAGLLASGTVATRRAPAAALVHAHWWFPGGVQAVAAGRRPLITTIHGTDLRLAQFHHAARAACAAVLRRSAMVTTVSSWLAGIAASLAPECAGRIRVLPLPVDERRFSPPGVDDQPRAELLFVGRLDRQKGAEVAVRALAALDGPSAQLRLRIVGRGDREGSLRALAGDLGVAGRITWEPPLQQAALADRYRTALALLVPGRDEGLGLVAVEAQLCATPVAAVASGGLTDVVIDRRTGRSFPPGDHRALARVIEDLHADPAAAAALAASGRRAALDRYGVRRCAQGFAALYAEVLADAAPGR